MPEAGVVQNAFNAGEIGPTLAGRGDVTAYKSGLSECENWLVLRSGGIEKRTGTQHISALTDETKVGLLHPFTFSETTNFLLSFTENAIHIWKDPEPASQALVYPRIYVTTTDAVDTRTDEMYLPSHGYAEGLIVEVSWEMGTEGVIPSGLEFFDEKKGYFYYKIRKPPTLTTPFDQTVAIDIATNEINVGAENLYAQIEDGQGPFIVTTSKEFPEGLLPETEYFIQDKHSDLIDGEFYLTVELSLSSTGPAVDITSTGGGTLTLTPTEQYYRDKFRLAELPGAKDVEAGPEEEYFVTLYTEGTPTWWIQPAGDEPVTVITTYTEAELQELQFAQDKDILYICHPDHEVQRLTRLNDTAWELRPVVFEDGPYFGIQRLDPFAKRSDVTMSVSGTGEGVRTVTATEPIFSTEDLGRSIRFGDPADVNLWGWGRFTSIDDPFFTKLDFNDADVSVSTTGLCTGSHTFKTGEGPVQVNAETGVDAYSGFIGNAYPGSFRVYNTQNNAIVGGATGRQDLNDTESPVATSVTSPWVYMPAHGFENNSPVTLSTSGSLPDWLDAGANYFLREVSRDFITFATTEGTSSTGIIAATGPPGGSGTHKIRGLNITSSHSARVLVQSELPHASPGSEWQLGAFDSRTSNGYPAAVTFHEQRLVLGGNRAAPQTLYGSQVGAYETFSPDEQSTAFRTEGEEIIPTEAYERVITDASAYQFTLQSEDLNTVRWLRSMRVLLAGTQGGIFAVMASSLGESITPTSVNAMRATQVGASSKSPVVLGTYLTFIEASGSIISQAEWQPDTESLETQDLFALAPHLGEGHQLKRGASTQNPMPAIWVVRSDGTLLHLTFDPTEKVAAWSRYVLGGKEAKVESVAILPDVEGGKVYVITNRGFESPEAPRINWETVPIASAYTNSSALESAIADDADNPMQYAYLNGVAIGDDPLRGEVTPVNPDTVQIDGQRWIYVDQEMKIYSDTVITFEVKTNALARSQGIIVSDNPTFRTSNDYETAPAGDPIAPFTYFKLFGGLNEAKGIKDYQFTPEIDEWTKVRIPIGEHLSTIATPGDSSGEGFYFGLYIDNDFELEPNYSSYSDANDLQVTTQYRNVQFTRPRRFIEMVSRRFYESSVVEDAVYVDCSLTIQSAADTGSTAVGTNPENSFAGFLHLAGQTVRVLADGAHYGELLVPADGTIVLSGDQGYHKVTAGIPYQATAKILPPEADTGRQQISTSMVWATSIQAMVRLNRSMGIQIGLDLEDLIPFVARTLQSYRDRPPALFTGVFESRLNVPAGRSNGWYIVSDDPYPCQVLSAMTRLEFSDR